MADKIKTVWKGDERRIAERRIAETQRYGRELTNAEREREASMSSDRRRIIDRRRAEIHSARLN